MSVEDQAYDLMAEALSEPKTVEKLEAGLTSLSALYESASFRDKAVVSGCLESVNTTLTIITSPDYERQGAPDRIAVIDDSNWDVSDTATIARAQAWLAEQDVDDPVEATAEPK